MLEYLIRCGLAVTSDKQGRTVLMHCARAAHASLLKLLLAHAQEWNIGRCSPVTQR